MTKVLLINGPPRSGKDIVGRMVADMTGAKVYKFAEALKVATHAMYRALSDEPVIAGIAHWQYEDTKDEPHKDFFGLAPRQAYIAASEAMLKPLHGQAFFGRLLARRIELEQPKFAVVTDSGFTIEALPLRKMFGVDNVRILKMHRKECTFDGDSREYLDYAGTYCRNDYDLDSLRAWLKGYLGTAGWLP